MIPRRKQDRIAPNEALPSTDHYFLFDVPLNDSPDGSRADVDCCCHGKRRH